MANLGHADGYYKTLCSLGGVAYIGAGCRWFTLQDAIEHWSNHRDNRRHTLCLLKAAKAWATLEGLAFHNR